MRIDHLWPSLLKLSEEKRQISRLRDRMSVEGKISDYYLPCPALTYDCGHKRSLGHARVTTEMESGLVRRQSNGTGGVSRTGTVTLCQRQPALAPCATK